MRMKHIHARDMQEAMKLARVQLGEDAVLLHSEKTDTGITVAFAIEEMGMEEALAAALHGDTDHTHHAPPPWLTPSPSRTETTPASAPFETDHPALDLLAEVIAFHALPISFTNGLIAAIKQTKIPLTPPLDAAETVLAKALQVMLKFKPLTIPTKPYPRALMLVGPYGAGKTTLIAKLATELTLKKHPVMIISTDTERMGGIAPLQSISDILKCDVLVAENRTQLRNLIKSQLGKHTLLIDSAGVNIYRFHELKALGEFASLADVEPILACPAGMDPKESEEMASVFSFLDIERVIFTRMDAVRHFSSVFHAIHHSNYALAQASVSASPAEALLPCSPELLARLMLTHSREKMAH
jgi:flagellar biosynthesis protein FlhF